MREKIAQGQVAYSMTVRLVRGVEIAAIARGAGFDTIYFDLEHSALSLETVGQISIAALHMGVAPFVRIPGVDAHLITRVLDAGAVGIIVPDLRSAADAQAVVNAVKYRPMGERSLPGVTPQLLFRSVPNAETREQINDATMIVAQIESNEGLAAVDEIASVPGIDILLVGANDLCAVNGITGQFDHDIIQNAYANTLAACQKHGKTLGVGGLNSRPDLMKKYITLGGRFVSLGADLSLLASAAAQKRKEME
ncbi:HpcH/HpaI aldolase family protein [Sphingobium bisphenolivorans]|uniref:HpcH/HpaI aldolase family protein n=1 Tax=Sphingobium bisphenolivorans TaxID=1335760 RepID=UPI00039B39EF|nr:aldolase/citrate lyase family protein [Sphingobium bisphenolivorans]